MLALADAWPYGLGYLFSIIGGHVASWAVVRPIWARVWARTGLLQVPYTGAILGYVERTLYTSSLLAGQPGFIGVWLALKVAGQWKRWEDPNEGRLYFNTFLTGSGVSLLYAAVGARAVTWASDAMWFNLIAVISLLVSGTWFLSFKTQAAARDIGPTSSDPR